MDDVDRYDSTFEDSVGFDTHRAHRNFISFVERTFRDRGVRTDVLHLKPRISLEAVLRRQILEGVQAVTRLDRQSQLTGKIPLQVFDRRAGADNVRFDGGSLS